MRRHAMWALGLATLMLLTGVAPSAQARRHGVPPATVADHCVRFDAGIIGSATSHDGGLTVSVTEWGADHRDFAWDGYGISQALVPVGRALAPWTGASEHPVAYVVFCSFIPTGPVGWLV